ncbi:hypothetical protein HYU18_03295 [Candidatus Woesearchaeota archaeon]|nr:hypothetical protein [Candidatus Woesearchaeota archaeon]
MPLSGMLTCGNCGSRTQVSTMRYNLSGTKLICQVCVEKERSGIKPGTTQSSSARLRQAQFRQSGNGSTAEATAGQEGEAIIGAAGDTTGYYCRSCHFKFSRKREADVSSCPYCGRQTVGQQYTGKAQDLIEESATEEGSFV